MTDDPTSRSTDLPGFNAQAVAIAKRQYFQAGEESVSDMFGRVAEWVAQAEPPAARAEAATSFYRLMSEQRFCPGGRVLAGAATAHGNVLNCFVQDGRPEEPGSDAWVMRLAGKLAAVTKVGGGNGLNLDPLAPKRQFTGRVGKAYLTVADSHPDADRIRTGTFLDLVRGETVTRGYRALAFVAPGALPAGVTVRRVADSVDDIWQAGADMVQALLAGRDVVIDLSDLRPEGAEVRGSGGTSSGPASFGVEVYDNFALWANLGGASFAGPVATLRYVFANTLRAIRQGGCLHPDTLVHTSKGTLRLDELVDGQLQGWHDHHMKVATDHGWKDSPRGFNNGVAETLRVTLANGQTVRGTPNHRLKVVRAGGAREWVALEDLQPGDAVIQVLDQHTGSPVILRPVDRDTDASELPRTPAVLDARLASWIGALWGAGCVEGDRVCLTLQRGSPLVAGGQRLAADLFGLDVVAERAEQAAAVRLVVTSAALVAWLRANGLCPAGAQERAMPKAVRMSSRPVVGSFLRAVFETSGSLDDSVPALFTASPRFADDVQTMLAGLGVPSLRGEDGVGRSSPRGSFCVRVEGDEHRERLRERLGLVLAASAPGVLALQRAEVTVAEQATSARHDGLQATSAAHHGGARAAAVARGSVERTTEGSRGLGRDEHAVAVVGVDAAGRSLTLDLSVDENRTYLASGFVSHNTRRGAGMATLSITHPDVADFITAKDLDREREEGDISTFNCSVLVGDEFMSTAAQHRAGVLWEIASHAWATGEPGLIYVDRINQHNPMRSALGDIVATNPCGEVVLYPGEPCDLGAINLAAYVTRPGTGVAGFDLDSFAADTRTCVRFLDDVLDVNVFALEDNREMSKSLRRLGLGVMGLADALIRMGYSYASQEGRDAVTLLIGTMRRAATEASQALARERGPFPFAGAADIATPRRNVAVLTVAPTGTTSMLFGVSSGVEPVFAPYVHRKIGTEYVAMVHPLFQELMERHQPAPGYAAGAAWDWDKVLAAVQANHGSVQGLAFVPDDVRAVLVCAHDIAAADHVRMQGAVQRAFDGGDGVANSISKTINLANEASIDDVFDAYTLAFAEGCKGITVYRDGSRDFQVLSTSSAPARQAAPVTAPAVEPAVRTAPVTATAEAVPFAFATAPAAGPGRSPAAMTVAVQGRSPAAVPAPDAGAGLAPARDAGPHLDRLPGEPLFDRPLRLQGQTDQVKLMLPNGDKRGFYVTVNKQDGLPVEVFIASGKAGDEANADSEALGRVVSIALQYGVPAEALVKTLRGINGGMFGSYHGRMVASKADLIAVALETSGVENVLARNAGCPECGGKLRYEEGCHKCERCGYSKCG